MIGGMLIPVKVAGITLDPTSKTPVVVLVGDDKILPIWIGGLEAHAILMQLQGIEPPRPMTHDLLKRVILSLSASVERIVITDIRDSVYYAEIIVKDGGVTIAIDARPSDAMALALRMECPILVESKVFDLISTETESETEEKPTPEQKERIRRYIENLKPEDFGNLDI
jgi:bifunctional DNase/RNase